jgi:hypothetical protein
LLGLLHAAVLLRIYRDEKARQNLLEKNREVQAAKNIALKKMSEKRLKKRKSFSRSKLENLKKKIFG